MTVNRADLDLSRFRYSCPNWWEGFTTGRQKAREQALKEAADWRAGDWQRGAAGRINEGEAA